MSGKQAFLEVLRQEGVSVMFGNPGTTELPLMDGLARSPGIRYVLALQESVAIAMADGYAQASGSLGAVNVHVSPGLGNAMGSASPPPSPSCGRSFRPWRSRS
jgi:benzoylformate decarboxylase